MIGNGPPRLDRMGMPGSALREYAEDWHERPLDAPDHANNWGLVQLISLSTDDQLREWLVGSAP